MGSAFLEYHFFWNGSASLSINEDNDFWDVTLNWPLTQTSLTCYPWSEVLQLNPDTPRQTPIHQVSSPASQWWHFPCETQIGHSKLIFFHKFSSSIRNLRPTAQIRFAGEAVALECCPRGHIPGLINPFILRAGCAPPEAPRRNVAWIQEAWIGSALPFLGEAGAYFVFQTLSDDRLLKAPFNHITRPELEWRTSLAIPLSQKHLDPVLYARLNLLWAHFQRCSLPLRCFWFALVHGCFLALPLPKSLRWKWRQNWIGGRCWVCCLVVRPHYIEGRKRASWQADGKMFGWRRNTVNSVISPLCCCAEAMQMWRVYDEYLISRCWFNLCCFQWT